MVNEHGLSDESKNQDNQKNASQVDETGADQSAAEVKNEEKTTESDADAPDVQPTPELDIHGDAPASPDKEIQKDIAVNQESSLESDMQEQPPPVAAKTTKKKSTPKEEPKDSDSGDGTTAEDKPNFAKKTKSKTTEPVAQEENDSEEVEKDDVANLDYSSLTKTQLVDEIKRLSDDVPIWKVDQYLKELKVAYNKYLDKERGAALEKFKGEGGIEVDFDYKLDDLDNDFDAQFKLIKDKKTTYTREQARKKEENLVKKQEVLEKLRSFVDSEETSISFETFKAIQQEWKTVGPIPGTQAKSLWANYNALVDRFYDQRSIYFELKELDRRKNLEAKLELCEKAERLKGLESLKDAIKELNDLHNEFKHIGPVPQEEQEPLWQRFKAASDAVYARRKVYVEGLKESLEANLKLKEELVEAVAALENFESDRIKDWNQKTKALLEIQKNWEAVGGVPREKSKHINRAFWKSFKAFFANKRAFFKQLDSMRDENLKKKEALVEKALALKESTEWDKTANELKNLQTEWREIGPVPERNRNEIYSKFKAACDHFFEQRRANHKSSDSDYVKNLKEKRAICQEIEKLEKDQSENIEKFRELVTKFHEIGFVPKSAISGIRKKYDEAVKAFMEDNPNLSDAEKGELQIENQITQISNQPNADQALNRKEHSIKRQISKVENDIALFRNNMEFFADNKSTNKLRDEVEEKIKAADDELINLKKQLKMLRELES